MLTYKTLFQIQDCENCF